MKKKRRARRTQRGACSPIRQNRGMSCLDEDGCSRSKVLKALHDSTDAQLLSHKSVAASALQASALQASAPSHDNAEAGAILRDMLQASRTCSSDRDEFMHAVKTVPHRPNIRLDPLPISGFPVVSFLSLLFLYLSPNWIGYFAIGPLWH